MEFIGTEVGIKIRSAIKAKLAELGKTVDDELIDYIMVMVANKKEQSHMAQDLQPFLESDTVKFTAWLHKVLQKLEQVTVIVTDEEYKLATNAFSTKTSSKKRKSVDSVSKKKSKDEPKEKKKKLKHVEHGKHSKIVNVDATKPGASASQSASTSKAKSTAAAVAPKPSASGKISKVKKAKIKTSEEVAEKKEAQSVGKKVPPRRPVSLSLSLDLEEPKVEDPAPAVAAQEQQAPAKPQVRALVPIQRPVMMVSDDDDEDDDFINIKTDMAEEDELLGEERAPPPQPSLNPPSEETKETPPVISRTVILDASKVELANSHVKVSEVSELAVRKALVAPRASAASTAPVRRTLRHEESSSPPPARKSSPLRVPRSSVRAISGTDSAPRVSVMSRIGAVLKRKASNLSDEEAESTKNGSMASVIQVKPRPKVPAAAQAPKHLLLRAMADARRSLATAPVREPPKPEPDRSPLYTRKFRDQRHAPQHHERIAITLPNIRDAQDVEVEEDEDLEEAETDEVMDLHAEEADEAYVPEVVKSKMPVDVVVYSPSPIVKPTTSKSQISHPEKRSNTPEFLVTLDGYKNYDTTYSRAYMSESAEEPALLAEDYMEDLEAEHAELQEPEEDQPMKPTRQKIVFNSDHSSEGSDLSKKPPLRSLDRCRFWPTCRQGDGCTFHHPTQTCKAFPNCSFGDRCLYIHPNCKFDASCTRKDCPFTHASPRNLVVPAPIIPVPVPRMVSHRAAVLPICRFFPNCSNTNCRFSHPKPCRFGSLCSNPHCTFSHSEIPPKDKMKWVSSVR